MRRLWLAMVGLTVLLRVGAAMDPASSDTTSSATNFDIPSYTGPPMPERWVTITLQDCNHTDTEPYAYLTFRQMLCMQCGSTQLMSRRFNVEFACGSSLTSPPEFEQYEASSSSSAPLCEYVTYGGYDSNDLAATCRPWTTRNTFAPFNLPVPSPNPYGYVAQCAASPYAVSKLSYVGFFYFANKTNNECKGLPDATFYYRRQTCMWNFALEGGSDQPYVIYGSSGMDRMLCSDAACTNCSAATNVTRTNTCMGMYAGVGYPMVSGYIMAVPTLAVSKAVLGISITLVLIFFVIFVAGTAVMMRRPVTPVTLVPGDVSQLAWGFGCGFFFCISGAVIFASPTRARTRLGWLYGASLVLFSVGACFMDLGDAYLLPWQTALWWVGVLQIIIAELLMLLAVRYHRQVRAADIIAGDEFLGLDARPSVNVGGVESSGTIDSKDSGPRVGGYGTAGPGAPALVSRTGVGSIAPQRPAQRPAPQPSPTPASGVAPITTAPNNESVDVAPQVARSETAGPVVVESNPVAAEAQLEPPAVLVDTTPVEQQSAPAANTEHREPETVETEHQTPVAVVEEHTVEIALENEAPPTYTETIPSITPASAAPVSSTSPGSSTPPSAVTPAPVEAVEAITVQEWLLSEGVKADQIEASLTWRDLGVLSKGDLQQAFGMLKGAALFERLQAVPEDRKR